AAFTVTPGNLSSTVTGVAVSAAVGKENAAAQAFNYATTAGSGNVQNSAFAIGTAGTLGATSVGDPKGTTFTPIADTKIGTAQANGFSSGYTIKLGTASGDTLGTAP
ncbi:MAG: hypothetical protein RLZZ338_172, partial [Cyanobacteriota bacterium]